MGKEELRIFFTADGRSFGLLQQQRQNIVRTYNN